MQRHAPLHHIMQQWDAKTVPQACFAFRPATLPVGQALYARFSTLRKFAQTGFGCPQIVNKLNGMVANPR